MSEREVCAACPVLQGECPRCLTFWIAIPGTGKRYGVRPVDVNPIIMAFGDTRGWNGWLNHLANVAERSP